MNVFDALSHLSRAALSRTRHGLAPTKVSDYTHHCVTQIALLCDQTNRITVRRIRKLGAALTALDDNSFGILCDYMGYYLYDSHSLANFLDNGFEIVLSDTGLFGTGLFKFKADGGFSACVSWDTTGNPTPHYTEMPWEIEFPASASQIWLWMQSLLPFEDPKPIKCLRSRWTINRTRDAFALYKTLNPSKKSIDLEEFCGLLIGFDKDLRLRLPSVFRKAARCPSFAL